MQDLHAVANAFRTALPPQGRVLVFRIDGLDRVGIPVVQATLLMPGQHATIGYGYGFQPIEAELGALGELCEEVHVGDWVARTPYRTASFATLRRALGPDRVVDPFTLCLPAGCDYDDDVELDWVAAQRWPDPGPVLVPREWVAAYPYQLGGRPPRLITPITNGLGAGLDPAYALAHAVMELTQRDGNVTSFRALDEGVVVELDTPLEPPVEALLARLRGLGIGVTVKLAGIELGIADLYVIGDDAGEMALPIQVTACGEASHPDRERALRKALLEFVGSRARKTSTHGPIQMVCAAVPADYAEPQIAAALGEEEEGRALEAMAEWISQDAATLRQRLAGVFGERRRIRLSELPTVAPEAVAISSERLALLAGRLTAAGLPLLWVDCSPVGGSVNVVKAIVPGLESETMSYHRIGRRGVRRLRDAGSSLLRDAPGPGLLRVRLRPEDEAAVGGPAWFDAGLAERQVALLYPMYRECGPFSAQLLLRRRRAA